MKKIELLPRISALTLAVMLFLTSARPAFATYDDPTCDSICDTLVDPSSKKVLNLAGTGAWGASDTAWCAANFSTSSTPTPAPSSDPNYQSEITRCQFHEGQMINYCMAYVSTAQADALETPLLVLDLAGAGLCGAACAGLDMNALTAACRLDSVASASLELYDTMTLDTSSTAKAIGFMIGAAGIGGVVLSEIDAGGILKAIKGNTGDSKQRNACISTAVLAAAAGVRIYDLKNQQMSQKQACTDVKTLLSSDPVIGVGTTPTATGTLMGTVGLPATGANNQTSYSNPSLLGNGQTGLSNQIACAASGSTTCDYMGSSSAASNGGLLASNGLGQAIANSLTPAQIAAVGNAIDSGADAGSLMSGALGTGLGDLGTKIVDIAKASQSDAANGKVPAVAAYSQSTGGAKKTTAAATSGFNFDLPATTAGAEQAFTRAPASVGGDGDIWHADYKGSIFQIVSTKINATKDRVAPLDWTTPLNRALMGLPPEPKQGAAQ
jgi:hypothetical protein